MEVKQAIRDLLDRLPDDSSLDDILYHLYVIREVERGLADADAGRVVAHEEVVAQLRRKWSVGADA